MTHADPRGPLVLDTRELGRRPGNMLEVHREVEAPELLGTDVISVPEGQPIELDLRLEAVVEGVLVTGSARATATGACVRCLEEVHVPVDVHLQELFAYADRAAHHQEVGVRTTRSCGSWTVTLPTWSPCSGTQWCLRCRSSRCAGTTAQACAPSAEPGWPTTRTTTMTR